MIYKFWDVFHSNRRLRVMLPKEQRADAKVKYLNYLRVNCLQCVSTTSYVLRKTIQFCSLWNRPTIIFDQFVVNSVVSRDSMFFPQMALADFLNHYSEVGSCKQCYLTWWQSVFWFLGFPQGRGQRDWFIETWNVCLTTWAVQRFSVVLFQHIR